MSHLRLAVFDVDGTLIDSQHTIVAAMTSAWARIGLGVPRPEDVLGVVTRESIADTIIADLSK